MKIFRSTTALAALFLCSHTLAARAADAAGVPSVTAAAVQNSKISTPWDTKFLFQAPKVYPAPGLEQEGVEAVFYDGLPWKGKPTRVFAYIGIPAHKPNEKVPGMVLVHGGGGTAYLAWVKLWVSRGYAAIAMDNCGSTPSTVTPYRARHEMGGPYGWGGFDQIDWPIADQWTYHAVADVLLANSLLRSRPEVDANRIGLTGISWGGYLTCIAAGLDNRFKFAVPVYGCGFIGDNSVWLPNFTAMGEENSKKWLGVWDPSRYLKQARMPFLWVDGSNDFAYPLDSLQKSYQLLPKGHSTLTTIIRMPHGHGGPGENPEEIHAFADYYLKGGPTLARIRKQEREGDTIMVSYISKNPIVRAELNYTKSRGPWVDRLWETTGARVYPQNEQVRATLPAGTSVYYLSLYDEQGHIVSSEHVEVPAAKLSSP